jgi:hypothetical protein
MTSPVVWVLIIFYANNYEVASSPGWAYKSQSACIAAGQRLITRNGGNSETMTISCQPVRIQN